MLCQPLLCRAVCDFLVCAVSQQCLSAHVALFKNATVKSQASRNFTKQLTFSWKRSTGSDFSPQCTISQMRHFGVKRPAWQIQVMLCNYLAQVSPQVAPLSASLANPGDVVQLCLWFIWHRQFARVDKEADLRPIARDFRGFKSHGLLFVSFNSHIPRQAFAPRGLPSARCDVESVWAAQNQHRESTKVTLQC